MRKRKILIFIGFMILWMVCAQFEIITFKSNSKSELNDSTPHVAAQMNVVERSEQEIKGQEHLFYVSTPFGSVGIL